MNETNYEHNNLFSIFWERPRLKTRGVNENIFILFMPRYQMKFSAGNFFSVVSEMKLW